jgi:hypothetical protein
MLKSPGSRPEFASPKLALVESMSASPPSTWRPLSEIVSGIVRDVQSKSAAEARASDLPKAA